MAKTRHGQTGIGERPYAGFSPKSPAASAKGTGKFTRLSQIGIGGRRYKYIGARNSGPFTRLTSFGIGGQRVAFIAKSPVTTDISGGSKGTKRKKKLTAEQILGLDTFGRIQMGLPVSEPETLIAPETIESPETIIAPSEQEITILGEGLGIPEPIEIDDDILLILAILEAHNA